MTAQRKKFIFVLESIDPHAKYPMMNWKRFFSSIKAAKEYAMMDYILQFASKYGLIGSIEWAKGWDACYLYSIGLLPVQYSIRRISIEN